MKKELQVENEKRRKLERSLSHVQEELDKTKDMADDLNQSKRLALAMVKQLHNEYSKLQKKYEQSIRNSQHNESIRRNRDSALAIQERRLSSLSDQLQSEVRRRQELENWLGREKTARSFLEEALNETIKQKDQLEDQIRHQQLEVRSVSSNETFHDCQEVQLSGISVQQKLQESEHAKQSMKENEKLPVKTSDKNVNACENEKLPVKTSDKNVDACDPNFDPDELINMKKRCAELENQLKQTFTVSQELNAAKKRCNELESQLKEYTTVSTELNEYRERLQKNVQQLQDVQSSFTQLQSAFKSAQAESNIRDTRPSTISNT
ncbi:tropomyosin-like [Schistocerca nitens]|uniref:tropomyosin-like n=1 Tax=Schistocerca nitens TaxID=7011 RepID=UPI0021187F0E|nr:tropomyosin-like [Schistocerca nitens]